MQSARQHDGSQDCAPCYAEMTARGVVWWRGCELCGVADCRACHKHPGQCAFGACTASATVLVRSKTTNEGRRMCQPCAELAKLTGWAREAVLA
jgi:hypothetical protein